MPLDSQSARALLAALDALRDAGDLVERVSHPDGAPRSPHPQDIADALFAALSGIADAERLLRRVVGAEVTPPAG